MGTKNSFANPGAVIDPELTYIMQRDEDDLSKYVMSFWISLFAF